MIRIWILSVTQFGSYLRVFHRHMLIRASLWRELSRDASHPVATHLRRQMNGARPWPVLRLSLVSGFVLLVSLAYFYAVFDHMIVWLLPVWLMLFSAPYCVLWIARIVPLLSRQSVLGVLDEISVIPPGRVFVYLTICKVVLNRDDAVLWLSLLRRVFAALVTLVLLLTLCIALSLISQSSILDLAAILVDLALSAAVIWLEHAQSCVIACLMAVEVSNRIGGNIDKTSVAVTVFALSQITCYALALAVIVLVDHIRLSAALFLFLLLRELLIAILWRRILDGANEESGHLTLSGLSATVAVEREGGPNRRKAFRPFV